MTRFSGKAVIVTAGASGIGEATAARFASQGALVRVASMAIERVEDREDWMERVPLHRPGQLADIAAAITFLAVDDASYIIGHNLVVDGGIAAHTGQPNFIRRQMGRPHDHGQ